MPKIPRYFSKEKAPPTPVQEIWPEYMAKGAGSAAAMGATALKGFAQIADALAEARDTSELMRVQNAWRQGINDFKLSLYDDTDYATYGERFEDTQKKLRGLLIQDYKGNVQAFNNFVEKELVLKQYEIQERAIKGEIRGLEAQYFQDLVSATKRVDRDFIERSTEAAIESGYLDPVKGQRAKEQALHETYYQEAWRDVMAAEGREEALAIIKEAPELTPGERNALTVAYDREMAAQEAAAKKKREEEISTTQADFLTRIYNPGDDTEALTHPEIDASNLPESGDGSKASYHRLLDSHTQDILSGRVSPYAYTDSKFLTEFFRVSRDPESPPMSSTDIAGFVDRKLVGTDMAEHLYKTVDVRGSDIFKLTEKTLQEQFAQEGLLKGFGYKAIGSIYYGRAMKDILAELAVRPKKGAELQQAMFEIAEPYLRAYWETIHELPGNVDEKLKAMGLPSTPSLNMLLKTREDKPGEATIPTYEYKDGKLIPVRSPK